jgi:WW domain-containing oxidoreductase
MATAEIAKKPFGSRTSADEVLENINLDGKNVVVTGANTGIGYEAARALAAAGANVIFACRSVDKGELAVANAKKRHPNAKAEFRQLNLASFENIKQFCEQLDVEKIDILICNAGLTMPKYSETEDGLEMTVGVCHFGHFLLTNLLMGKLLAAKEPRVVMVSSESHRYPATLNLDNYPLTKLSYSFMVAYGQAKLSNTLFANELQRRYSDKGLTACSLHPGTLITTDIARNSRAAFIMKLISPLTKNTNQGASTTVFCAAYEKKENLGGQYFSHCKKSKATKEANSPEVAQKLWALSETVCHLNEVVETV